MGGCWWRGAWARRERREPKETTVPKAARTISSTAEVRGLPRAQRQGPRQEEKERERDSVARDRGAVRREA
eukprot:3588159-Rhodomonas_salina.1